MNKKRERRPGRRISAGTIQGILALIVIIFVIPGFLLSLMSPTDPGTYYFYSGPILPLSSLSGGEHIEVSRDVTLDFSIYGAPKEYSVDPERVKVTDSYILNNPTGEAVTMELSWGFDTKFSEHIPVITVDGATVEGTVRAGGLTADPKKPMIQNYEKYKKLLTERDFLAEAMEEAPLWDAPAKVYHFYNMAYSGEETYPPMLGLSWKDEKNTSVWVRTGGITGTRISGTDKGRNFMNFPFGEEVWLYVIGEDLVDLSGGGTRSHTMGTYTESKIEGLTYELETYESTFAEYVMEAARAYVEQVELEGPGAELVTPQMLINEVMKQIADGTIRTDGGFGGVDVCFYDFDMNRRMIYWVFPVEIPAGGSVTVSADYIKESSYNSDDIRHGYDIATTLGSNLNFTEQKATLVNTDPILLAELTGGQNFGFDLAAGVTTVTLDTSVERYFMDLLLKE